MVKNGPLAVSAVAIVIVLALGAVAGVELTADYAVKLDAEHKANQWAGFLATNIPQIEDVMSNGQPTDEQRREMQSAAHIGDVYGFRLFDWTGRLIVVSNEETGSLRYGQSTQRESTALRVAVSGKPVIITHNGTKTKGEPPVSVEAYVPMKDKLGQNLGVVDVYLDQTTVASLFHLASRGLALTLSVVFAFAFGAPFLAFMFKNRQVAQSRRQAEYLAHYDQLTGLLNRTGFSHRLGNIPKAGKMSKRCVAAIFLDVDLFKQINDTYGHSAGDAFLKRVGHAVHTLVRPDDLASRLGGDELVIIAWRDSISEIARFVQDLQTAVSAPLCFDGTTFVGHLSIGIDYGPVGEVSMETRMRRADLALYEAKREGRNCFRLFTPDLELGAQRRREVEAAILSGLEQDRFELHYQPLIHPKSHVCRGFEALLRLYDDDGQLIAPDSFIAVAETMGMIGPISAWVVEQAVRQAAEWPEHLFVAVNLSARQFKDETVVPLVRRVLLETGFSPSRLELEVTESLLMENSASVDRQLAELRQLGVSLVMDDFGTGYSNLGYLAQFGFDKLKIDRSFVTALGKNRRRARAILDSIIGLGHRLGMTVTAEGIENAEQDWLLASMSCDLVQGFFYSVPLPATELAGFLLNQVSPAPAKADSVWPKLDTGSA